MVTDDILLLINNIGKGGNSKSNKQNMATLRHNIQMRKKHRIFLIFLM